MTNIYAKPAFLNTNSSQPFISKEQSYKGHGHLQRVSSMIRGDQIADYIGAQLNPEKSTEEDVNIYVKPHLPKGVTEFSTLPGRNYIDIVDGWGLMPVLERYEDIGVIACSKQDQFKLESILKNKVVFIPQHHANYDRLRRTRKGIKTIGVIGTKDAFKWLPEGLEEALEKRDIALLTYSKFFSRQDIIDFYLQIDVQIVWRPYRMRLSNPLKIVNASSFGIPTIAYDESVFQEMAGCYLPVQTFDELLDQVDMVEKSPLLYESIADNCHMLAEDYHIKNVAKLYKKL